jgi:ABC-type transport system substrate-binding protein
MFVPDANTALASMLSGDVDFAAGTTLRVANSFTLKQEWEPKQAGTVFYQVYTWHGLVVQFLPGLTSPQSLLDVRVRRALAHSIDRAAINDAINGGIALEADYYLPPNGIWGAEVQRGVVKHNYDLQMTDQLMREVGFTKGADGVYASPGSGPFTFELMANTTDVIEAPAIANDWEKIGFKVNQRVIPPALALDQANKLGFPGVAITTQPATERTAVAPVPGNIPTPDNGWRGGSQISWTNPEYTRLVDQFSSTLDRTQRGEQMTQMAHVFSDDLGAISTHFPPLVWASAAKITGPHEGPPETNVFWNIHQWELK